MKLITLASSSVGNCHILNGDNESIMLDCGIKIENRLNIISQYNVKSMLVTHSHGDHIKGLTANVNLIPQINVYGSKETLECCKLFPYQKKEIEPMKKYKIGNEFIVIPVEVPHDARCYAYFIKHIPSNENVLYLTDCGYADQLTFKDVDYFLVECNFDEEWYTDIQKGDDGYFKVKRLTGGKGHISIQQCKRFLQKNINHNTKKVILGHISHSYEHYGDFGISVREEINNSEIGVVALNNHIKRDEIVINDLVEKQIELDVEF